MKHYVNHLLLSHCLIIILKIGINAKNGAKLKRVIIIISD